ncbi:MAG: ATP phosphoribosyltransferase [Chloroflexi bacterium]|nr:ATP phosphoribosyltransferase [Chloroflexota bacterium]
MPDLRIALPSEGALAASATELFREAGLRVNRSSDRTYIAGIPALDGVEALYQRASDITGLVDRAVADIGIVGRDQYEEVRDENGNSVVLIPDLKFGESDLVLAVPDEWTEVNTINDLAGKAEEIRRSGRLLRIATKYPRLVGRFLAENGIEAFEPVDAKGGLEARPAIGDADMIADITASGQTLRHNRLRRLDDRPIRRSSAILIGNLKSLDRDENGLDSVRQILERLEARVAAQDYQWVVANIEGESPEAVASRVNSDARYSGLQGPTISPVFSKTGGTWFSVQVVVPKKDLIPAIDYMRKLGASGITVNDPAYVFATPCNAYAELREKLGRPLESHNGRRG